MERKQEDKQEIQRTRRIRLAGSLCFRNCRTLQKKDIFGFKKKTGRNVRASFSTIQMSCNIIMDHGYDVVGYILYKCCFCCKGTALMGEKITYSSHVIIILCEYYLKSMQKCISSSHAMELHTDM